jgi:hypothetical protein
MKSRGMSTSPKNVDINSPFSVEDDSHSFKEAKRCGIVQRRGVLHII